jgi:hypothetical protein
MRLTALSCLLLGALCGAASPSSPCSIPTRNSKRRDARRPKARQRRAGPPHGSSGRRTPAATYSVFRSIFRRRDPDLVRKRFVERCLAERGYEVAGWR